jgi:hypothetical protein
VYDALGLPFDPASVGSIRDEAPGVSPEVVGEAVVAAFTARLATAPGELAAATLDRATLDRATALVPDHRVGQGSSPG